MKIENGLLFVAACQLSADYKNSGLAGSIEACVPIRKISHMKEHPHRGKVYTVLHLDNGDEIIASATIPDMIQLIREARAMSLFGQMSAHAFPSPEVIVNGSDLKVMLERNIKRNEGPKSFAKGGMIPPGEAMDAMI
ncbi:hypothetical protein [Dyadobacter fermentans]|uniref:Uncharacterized protein n=1 Tax=Dyadobacter fermentans (strain ATCC 700827 / DSM 18053 / CIP 107007 / KCTC 52180 / NS114) TaxID=471854 RepID=C6VVG3_DYAFD|nr:hypothetical protein [Dyadobacter fermentans]ACT96693.1 hypothetical protein Dfer_5502 [Dyadobacter fermentans DSM 18053]